MPTVPSGSNTGPFGVPPGGPWFVFGGTGTIQRQSNPLLATALANSGWVGFATQSAAEAYAHSGVGGAARGAASDVNKGATTALGGINAIGDFFNRLTEANTWIRVGEVVAGVLILYIGLKATTSNTAVGNAVKQTTAPVKKAAKAAGTAAIL